MTFGNPSPVFVVQVTAAVLRGDWSLARWAHRHAVLARVAALYDAGEPVDVGELPEAPRGVRGGW
jgi:hypothetical protein